MRGKPVFRKNWIDTYRRRKRRAGLIAVYGNAPASVALPAMQMPVNIVAPAVPAGASLSVGLQVISQIGNPAVSPGTVANIPGFPVETILGTFVAGSAVVALPAMQVSNAVVSPSIVPDVSLVPVGLQSQTQLLALTTVTSADLAIGYMKLEITPLAQVVVLQELDLQEILLEEFPVEIEQERLLDLELEEIFTDDCLPAISYPIVPASKFMEIGQTGQVIYGSEPDQLFKLNPVARISSGDGLSLVQQLSVVKPDFVTTDGLFDILTPIFELQPLDFDYQAPGGFLRIWNSSLIQASLVPDGDTAAISTALSTVADVFTLPAFTTFAATRQ